MPTIVMVYDDVDVTDGLKFNGTEWQHIKVDSVYARNNLCWVVAINESVNNQGLISAQSYFEEKEGNEINGSKIETRGECAKALQLAKIKVTDIKEGFWGGCGEMYMIVDRIVGSCNYPFSDPQLFNNTTIKKAGSWLDVKFDNASTGLLFTNEISNVKRKCLENLESTGWIMYERDNYKKYEKAKYIPWCSKTYYYKSKQTPFGIEPYINFKGCLTDNTWHDLGEWSYDEGHIINLRLKQIN